MAAVKKALFIFMACLLAAGCASKKKQTPTSTTAETETTVTAAETPGEAPEETPAPVETSETEAATPEETGEQPAVPPELEPAPDAGIMYPALPETYTAENDTATAEESTSELLSFVMPELPPAPDTPLAKFRDFWLGMSIENWAMLAFPKVPETPPGAETEESTETSEEGTVTSETIETAPEETVTPEATETAPEEIVTPEATETAPEEIVTPEATETEPEAQPAPEAETPTETEPTSTETKPVTPPPGSKPVYKLLPMLLNEPRVTRFISTDVTEVGIDHVTYTFFKDRLVMIDVFYRTSWFSDVILDDFLQKIKEIYGEPNSEEWVQEGYRGSVVWDDGSYNVKLTVYNGRPFSLKLVHLELKSEVQAYIEELRKENSARKLEEIKF